VEVGVNFNPIDEPESEDEEEEMRVVSIRDLTVQQQQPITSIAERMIEIATEFPTFAIDNLTVRPKEIFERGTQATTMPQRRSENAEQAFEKMNTEEYKQQQKQQQEGYHEDLPQNINLSQCFCSKPVD
jgi:hypothetical protein